MSESRFLADIPDDVIDWERRESSTDSIRSGHSAWGGSPVVGSGGSKFTGSGNWGAGAFGLTRDRSATISTSRTQSSKSQKASKAPELAESEITALATGDKVIHDSFGLGKVVSVEGFGKNAVGRIDFGSDGVKRLLLRHAPLEKL
jgi:DNA helicase-2/ATP-dependent DNA helicase PcrA